MTNKRQCIDGFSPQTTPIRINKLREWAFYGKWRDFDVVRVQYTYLRRVWECQDKTVPIFYLFIPNGNFYCS